MRMFIRCVLGGQNSHAELGVWHVQVVMISSTLFVRLRMDMRIEAWASEITKANRKKIPIGRRLCYVLFNASADRNYSNVCLAPFFFQGNDKNQCLEAKKQLDLCFLERPCIIANQFSNEGRSKEA